ncbi:hypothetical protein M2149_000411 [Lachnospiraceae bacterium PFB1-21]
MGKRGLAFFLVISLIISSLSLGSIVQAQDSPTEIETLTMRKEIVLEGQSIEQQLSKYEDNAIEGLLTCEQLSIVTVDYYFTWDDYVYLKNQFIQLKELDLNECQFADVSVSENIQKDMWVSVLLSTPPVNDEQQNNNMSSLQSLMDSEGENLSRGIDLRVQLNGFCIINNGSSIDLGIAYDSNDPDVLFAFEIYDLQTKKWTTVADWQKSNWITWHPIDRGNYWLHVKAKLGDGKSVTYTQGYFYEGVNLELQALHVLDKVDHYDLGIAYKTNDRNVSFTWKIYNLQTKTWETISENYKGNWVSWEPKKKGSYWIHVEAKAANGMQKTYTRSFYYSGKYLSFEGICQVQRKNQIDFGVAYKTNDKQVEFKWQVYDISSQTWSIVRDFGDGNWISWKPKKPGDYLIHVEGRTSTGESVSKAIGYHVVGPKIHTYTANPKSPYWANKPISFSGEYTDFAQQVKRERFLVYDGRNWTEMPMVEGMATWTAKEVRQYAVCYQLLDANNSVLDEKFQYYNIETPYLRHNGIYVRYDGNRTYGIAANVSTNDREVMYKWQYYDVTNKKWYLISDWSRSNASTWKPQSQGNYWLHVTAKRSDGVESAYTLGYNASFIKVLGSFSTQSTNNANGWHNMALALNRCNGVTLMPGQTFSFSLKTGPWSGGNGYVIAGVVGGQGWGGGVCQASTTLYGAAIRSGMTIVERRNHSVPSTYCPRGLDAMVATGSSDLKFRNDFNFPVTIRTSAYGNVLYAEIVGDDPGWFDRIEPFSWSTGGGSYAACRVYYKNNVEVHRNALPNSYY